MPSNTQLLIIAAVVVAAIIFFKKKRVVILDQPVNTPPVYEEVNMPTL